MSKLVDKQVNVQKESLKTLPGFTQNSRMPTQNSRNPTKKCAMKMKETKKQRNKQRKKNDGRLKYFLMEEGVYKARAENSYHGYQTTSDQRFFIH